MPLMSVVKCWRGRADCESFDSIEAIPEDTPEERVYELDYEPKSFVCCGCIIDKHRAIKQDAYRLCFKNSCSDEMSDNDEQDLTHILAVVSKALAIVATLRVNGGTVQIPTMQGDDGGSCGRAHERKDNRRARHELDRQRTCRNFVAHDLVCYDDWQAARNSLTSA